MKRYLYRFFAAIIILPLLGVVTWYCVSFLPHVSEMNEICKKGDAIVSSAPLVLYDMALASESKKSIRSFAISKAYWNLGYKEKAEKSLAFHLDESLWFFASWRNWTTEAWRPL